MICKTLITIFLVMRYYGDLAKIAKTDCESHIAVFAVLACSIMFAGLGFCLYLV